MVQSYPEPPPTVSIFKAPNPTDTRGPVTGPGTFIWGHIRSWKTLAAQFQQKPCKGSKTLECPKKLEWGNYLESQGDPANRLIIRIARITTCAIGVAGLLRTLGGSSFWTSWGSRVYRVFIGGILGLYKDNEE